MPIKDSKVKEIYDVLSGGGANVGTEDDFNAWFYKEGDEGLKNRQWVWSTLHEGGADVGDSYEVFSDALGVGAKATVPEEPIPEEYLPEPPETSLAPGKEPFDVSRHSDEIAALSTAGDDFSDKVQGSIDNIKRNAEAMTPEGMKRDRDMKGLAKAVGVNTNLAPAPAPAPKVGEAAGKPGEPSPQWSRNPEVAGIERDANGELVAKWRLGDGSETTDFAEASRAAYAAGEARRRFNRMQELERRLAENEKAMRDRDDLLSKRFDANREDAARRRDGESGFEHFLRTVSNLNYDAAQMMHHTPNAKPDPKGRLYAENVLLRKAIRREKAADNKDGGFWTNVWNGITDTDLSDWDLGVTDLSTAVELSRIKDKYEAGEALSGDESNLVTAAGLLGEANSREVSHGYTAGEITRLMVPFMVQIAMNPASGLGKGTARAFAKQMIRRYGLSGGKLRWATRGARVVGDVGEAAVLSGTLQAASTAADVVNRRTGEALVATNELGRAEIAGFTEGESTASAIYKGVAASTIENYTELLGGHFEVVGKALKSGTAKILGKGGAKLAGHGKVGDLMGMALSRTSDFISSKGVAKWQMSLRKVEEQVQFNGFINEVLEEEAAIVLNSIAVGDEQISNLWDKDHQIDILLGIGLTSGAFGVIRSGSYTYGRYRYNKKALDTADRIANYRFGSEWDAIRDNIDMASDKDLPEVLKGILQSDPNMSEFTRKALLNYAYTLQQYRGYWLMDDVRRKQQDEIATNLDNTYQQGYDNANPELIAQTTKAAELARERLVGALDEEIVRDKFDTDPIGALERTHDPEIRRIAIDYINAKEAQRGALQGVSDDVDSRIAEMEAHIDDLTNRESGKVLEVLLGGDHRVAIVSGELAIDRDGTVNVPGSTPTLIYRDWESGELGTAAPADIVSVLSENNPDLWKESGKKAINDEVEAEIAAVEAPTEEEAAAAQTEIDNSRADAEASVDASPVMSAAEREAAGYNTNQWVGVPSMPILEDGEPDYMSVSPERTHSFLYDGEAGITKEQADAHVKANLDYANKELEAIEKRSPKMGRSIAEFNKAKAEWQSKYDAAKAAVEYWEAVKGQTAKEQEAINLPEEHQSPIKPIGFGDFGPIYNQFVGDAQGAVHQLVRMQDGEALGALSHPEIGEIDLVWGEEGTGHSDGYGLSKLVKYHPEIVGQLQEVINSMSVVRRSSNRVQLESEKYQAGVRLTWNNEKKTWLLTAFEKRKTSESTDKRTDTDDSPTDLRGDTALSQNPDVSNSKGSVLPEEKQANRGESLSEGVDISTIPEWQKESAAQSRQRGVRRAAGRIVARPEPLTDVVVSDRGVNIQFATDAGVEARVAVIEASALQPSHVQGNANPLHFINDAQPKNRDDNGLSAGSAQKIARDLNPEMITGGVTAYVGAPVVNSRGEVIQGNNRSDALRYMWESVPESADGYKQYLIDNAERFGLDAASIAAMEHPVLVNMVDVTDEEAVKLGQYTSSDLESGGIEAIKTANTMGLIAADGRTADFVGLVMRQSDDEAMTMSELIEANGLEALQWLATNGYISDTQYASARKSNGSLTDEGKGAIRKLIFNTIFEGSPEGLEAVFTNLPAAAQNAILSTAWRDSQSAESERMLHEIQESIQAYNEMRAYRPFADAKNIGEAMDAMRAWASQTEFDDITGEMVVPSAKYSNFALMLAALYRKATQRTIAQRFNGIYDLVQGVGGDLFATQSEPMSLAAAIRETLNIEYKPINNQPDHGKDGGNVLADGDTSGQSGRSRSSGGAQLREQSQTGAEPAERGRGAEEDFRGAGARPLTEEEAAEFITRMEEAAQQDPEVELTPQSWIDSFGINNSIETPIGNVKMGENQYAKLKDLKRSSEFGMVVETLSAPDVIFIEPSTAKPGQITERPFSYVFTKTFRRNGETIKFYTSVTVQIDGLEISTSSHMVSKESKIKEKLTSFERKYTKKTLLPNSSEWRLAEHHEDVPDLLPTQGNSVSTSKDSNKPEKEQTKTQGYTIAPKPSTNKLGDRLDTDRATFDRELDREEKRKPASRDVYSAAKGLLEAVGIVVHEVSDEEAQTTLDKGDGFRMSAAKRRALDTLKGGSALQSNEVGSGLNDHQGSVTKFDSAANVRQNLEMLAGKYEKIDFASEKTICGELSKALGLRNNGNHSNYGTFEAKNGTIIRIRISDHNAQVKNFDDAGYDNGISIVVTRKTNEGLVNNGEAHIVEYYYNGYKLAKSDGHPLAEIARSMQQLLYSGEFKDMTGLAERQEVNGAEARMLRDSIGTVYGWTVGGEVWLNRDAMNPETPVHEYTHLWDAMVQRENPALWERGKELMKQIPLWNDIINDPNYAAIRGDEDAVASEVHSRLTGERGAEILDDMLKSARKAGLEAEAESIITQLRNWIGEMFAGLKKTLSRWSRRDLKNLTASRFADMTLRDLAEGVNPNHGGKELVMLHNISESKLRKVLKAGGLANPSMAVVRTGFNRHDGYGSITLVAPGAMADKSSGRNAGTWAGDAWTPTYPAVERDQSLVDRAEVIATIAKAVPDDMRNLTLRGWESHMSGGNESSLAYWFLSERGEAPEIARRKRRFDVQMAEQVLDIVKERPLKSLDKDEAYRLRDIYIREVMDGDESNYAKYMELSEQSARERLGKPAGLMRMKAELSLDLIERLGLLPSIDGWVSDIRSDARLGERTDEYATSSEANRIIGDNGLTGEFEQWVESLDDRYGVTERLFAGYTAGGTRRYVDNTVENASRLMRSEGRNGATGMSTGFSNFVATMLKPMKSHKEMQAQSDRLRDTHVDTEAFDEKWSDVYFDLAIKCQPEAERISDDYGFYRLTEAALKPDPAGYLKREYGVELSAEDTGLLKDMITAIRTERPVKYFETKFERPVHLDEFVAAVVPNDIDKELEAALSEAGLKIEKYSPDKVDDRQRAVAKMSNIDGVRFHTAMSRNESNFDTRNTQSAVEEEMNRSLTDDTGDLYREDDGSRKSWSMDVFPDSEAAKLGASQRKEVREYLSTYRSAPIRVIASETEIATLASTEGWDEETKEGMISRFHDEDILACYVEGGDKIYIFANHDAGYPMERILLHENSHAVIDRVRDQLGDTFLDDFMNAVLNANNKTSFYNKRAKFIAENYPPERVAEEFIAYTTRHILYGKNKELLLSRIDPQLGKTYESLIINNIYGPNTVSSKNRIIYPASSGTGGTGGHFGRGAESGRESADADGSGVSRQSSHSGQLHRGVDERRADGAVSEEVDIWERPWGETQRIKEERQAATARQRRRMADRVEALSERLHLDNVDIVEDGAALTGRRAKSKGFFNRHTGRITIVLSNHSSVADVEQTLLHEAVGHYGLRQLFGRTFDSFLDEVFEAADATIRRKIGEMSLRHGWDVRTATEEYLASLAETTDFAHRAGRDSWIQRVKRLFMSMLEKVGFKGFNNRGETVTDNELRYILWRSYENLKQHGERSLVDEAADVDMQSRLEVGEFAAQQKTDAVGNGQFVESVNARFNEQLKKLASGELTAGELQLGNPGIKLRSSGVNGTKIVLDCDVLRKKMSESYKHEHPFDYADIKDLPKAINDPVAVFTSKGHGDFNILVEISRDGKNFIVSLKARTKATKGGEIVVDEIVTLYPKGEKGIVNWINNGQTVFIDKEKALEWLTRREPHVHKYTNQELEDATKIVENFENPTITEEKSAEEEGDLYRNGDYTPRDRVIVRDLYERMCSSSAFQVTEAMQDSMMGLKAFYKSVLGKGTNMEDIADYENAYIAENAMSSANNAQQHEYTTRYIKPLLREIGSLTRGRNEDRRILTDYLMAKHGLERNALMRKEAASKKMDTDRDFAGLCGLTGLDSWRDAETKAQRMVDDYEAAHDTTQLWVLINEATQATLDKLFTSGLLSERGYNKTLNMYNYYVPLRGFDEKTSADVYGYLTSKDGPMIGSVMKKAKGRKSKADDPITTIAAIADTAIRQGNRNVMKQKFLNFVQNNPSDLASVNEMWLAYDSVSDEWVPVFADIHSGMTASEVEIEIAEFEKKMRGLARKEPNKYKRSHDAVDIPYKIMKGAVSEHQVVVKRNGRTFVITINGNPRAAQAINGLTNPDVEAGDVVGFALKCVQKANRYMSTAYTTRNPDFVVSNFIRDALYSNPMVWVKESPAYAIRFHANYFSFNPVNLYRLMRKWEKGTLNMANKTEKHFYDFMKNGGETGYTSIKDIEGYKRTIAAELKKQGSMSRRVWSALGMELDLLNRSVENCARFAAYKTSREMGRSVGRSIYDAKEISVNFNKKGSGGKMISANGQTGIGKAAGYVSGGGRLMYVFWNAAVQGSTNFGRVAKRHPAKAMAALSSMITLGFLQPILAGIMGGDGDDGDENSYYNLPEYKRRSNLCIRAGDSWVTIPLPVESRAIFGLGELAYGVMSGKEGYSDTELAYAIASQVSQILPIDMLEGGGGLHPIIPSVIKPIAEVSTNRSWTGLPIYRDNYFNTYDPEWQKAYQSTDRHLVDATRWLNEISGGSDHRKGSIDINPAKVEYLLNSTLGGVFSFPAKVKKSAETVFGDREFEWRNTPLVNRLVTQGDERTAFRKLQNEYFSNIDNYKAIENEVSGYRKDIQAGLTDSDPIKAAETMTFFQSDDYLRYEITREIDRQIDQLNAAIKQMPEGGEKKEMEAARYNLMRQVVAAMKDPKEYLKAVGE